MHTKRHEASAPLFDGLSPKDTSAPAASLGAGATFAGPAVVEERETTSVIRPGWNVEVAADGSLIASKQSS